MKQPAAAAPDRQREQRPEIAKALQAALAAVELGAHRPSLDQPG
jgi:hypothetical protein